MFKKNSILQSYKYSKEEWGIKCILFNFKVIKRKGKIQRGELAMNIKIKTNVG